MENEAGAGALRQTGERRTPARHYVYAHRHPDGTPFYIGKGIGRRAWSMDRDALWHHFITTRCGGSYDVFIVAEGLEEDDALELEAELIAAHGVRLLNWINPGRGFDYAALERFHALRDATTSFISQTRPLEQSDPDLAVARYREAIDRVHAYARMETETGLVAELRRELKQHYADVSPLDRLTLMLRKLGRFAELVECVDAYFTHYPDSVSPNHAVLRRRAEAAAVLAGERRPARRPSVLKPRKTGVVPEGELAPLLDKARSDRAPWNWRVAAQLCRKHGDIARERDLLEEFLSGPRVVGRSWLELEERLFKVRAMLEAQAG
ncbi:GIY-YIG nuclease family protein [Sphingomonas sp. MG17]|uniref:GIY-YIG nuclease family protein n=1 Tax=Sphingomonas tagetis TaxID=2949092 RepID=A0A9X2HMV2_9SPHN|nr:GIY-YIG nuclease family protein [Sphingomonas tagetis]MCP3732577.1 GIY-YIG nuclease family protein [Sphingomonas tagetis]